MREKDQSRFELNSSILKDFDTLMTMRLDFVEELVVSEIDSNSKLLNIIGLCINVKTLVIESDTRINTDSVIANICKPEKIEILILNNVKLPNEKSMKSLCELKMILLSNIRFSSVSKFLSYISNPCKIEGLSFSDIDFGKSSIDILERFSSIKYLNLANLDNCKFENMDFIQKNKSLKKLSIKNNKIKIDEIRNLINGTYKKNIFVEIDLGDPKSKTRETLAITEEGNSTITAYTTNLQTIVDKINLSKIDNLTLVLNGVNDICKYEKKLRKVRKNINIIIKDISFLTVKTAEYLKDSIMVEKVYLKEMNISNKKVCYLIDSYIKMKKEVDKIVFEVKKSEDEYKRFIQMYYLIGKIFELDDEEQATVSDIAKLEKTALLTKKCSQMMYAKILKDCLSCINIESEIIIGYVNKKPHMWNQVKINNKWYNVDLALDIQNITNKKIFRKKLKYCLINDNTFYRTHTASSKHRKRVPENYDPKENNLKSGYKNSFLKTIKKIFRINRYRALPSGNREK